MMDLMKRFWWLKRYDAIINDWIEDNYYEFEENFKKWVSQNYTTKEWKTIFEEETPEEVFYKLTVHICN